MGGAWGVNHGMVGIQSHTSKRNASNRIMSLIFSCMVTCCCCCCLLPPVVVMVTASAAQHKQRVIIDGNHRWQVRAVVLRPFPLVFVFFFSCPLNSTRQGSQRFDTSRKMRPPAWTDRILFAPPGPQAISPLKYTSVPGSCHSDHRPVYAKFRVRLDD